MEGLGEDLVLRHQRDVLQDGQVVQRGGRQQRSIYNAEMRREDKEEEASVMLHVRKQKKDDGWRWNVK
jgi:hypothetical protein